MMVIGTNWRRIEAELGKEALADHQRPLRRGEQRVAVGLGAIDDLGAEILRGARPVLDHHRLAEFRRQMLGEDARHQIAVGAGRQRHDDADRAGRIGLRGGGVAGAATSLRARCNQGAGAASSSALPFSASRSEQRSTGAAHDMRDGPAEAGPSRIAVSFRTIDAAAGAMTPHSGRASAHHRSDYYARQTPVRRLHHDTARRARRIGRQRPNSLR